MAHLLIEWGFLLSLIVSFVALILAGFALSRVGRQMDEAQKLYQKISRELALATSGSVGMGQRLLAMEKRLREQPTAEPENLDDDEDFKAYAQAAQLFKLGMNSEEVSQRCGLSRAEASLMEMMHKANR